MWAQFMVFKHSIALSLAKLGWKKVELSPRTSLQYLSATFSPSHFSLSLSFMRKCLSAQVGESSCLSFCLVAIIYLFFGGIFIVFRHVLLIREGLGSNDLHIIHKRRKSVRGVEGIKATSQIPRWWFPTVEIKKHTERLFLFYRPQHNSDPKDRKRWATIDVTSRHAKTTVGVWSQITE